LAEPATKQRAAVFTRKDIDDCSRDGEHECNQGAGTAARPISGDYVRRNLEVLLCSGRLEIRLHIASFCLRQPLIEHQSLCTSPTRWFVTARPGFPYRQPAAVGFASRSWPEGSRGPGANSGLVRDLHIRPEGREQGRQPAGR